MPLKDFRPAVFLPLLVVCASSASAQSVEIVPFGGYRFGGDFFELVAEHPVDMDGSPAVGFVVNVPLSDGMQVEALVSHQTADVSVQTWSAGRTPRWRIAIDHVQAGGLQEFGAGRMRPFLTGVLGLTRYGAAGDSEYRFSVGAGGGVKLFPVSQFGIRLDGRLHSTLIDADTNFLVCVGGTCITSLRVSVVWQAEFTAGIIVRLK